MTHLKLYGNPLSGHSYKVKLFLALTDTSYDYEHVDLLQPRDERPEFFRENARFHEVPMLVIDDVPHVQSNAILLHLANKLDFMHGGSQRQQVTEWLMWEQSRLGHSLPNLRFAKRFLKNTNLAVLDWLEARLRGDLDTLNNHLDGKIFVVGNAPSIADCSLAGYLFWLDEAGLMIEEWPWVQLWLERVSKLKGWQHPDDL